MILAGDVGGTKVHLALYNFEGGRLRSLREHSVAGIIMSPARGTDTWTLAQQWPRNIPAVITMRRMIGSSLPYIGPDNHRGERYAVEHLLRLGHRRIGFIGGDSGMTTQQERVGGWRAALNGWGVAADEALIFEAPPTRDGGRIAIERALAGARVAAEPLYDPENARLRG